MTEINSIKLRNVEDLSSNALVKNLVENENGSMSGKIKVGYKTYLVNVSDTGKVDVHRKLGFFGRLFIRNSHTATSCRFEKKIADLISTNEYAIAKNSQTELKNIIRNSGNKKTVEVANYGMKGNRITLVGSGVVEDLSKKTPGKTVVLNTIDEYNKRIGIGPNTLITENHEKTMNSIASGKFKPNEDEDGNYPEEKLKLWGKFLARPENMEKINIPKKLFRYLHQDPGADGGIQKTTGWKAAFRQNPTQALKQFVMKNLPFGSGKPTDAEISFLADKLRQYVEIYNDNNRDTRQQKLNSFFKSRNWKLGGTNKTPAEMKVAFENVIVYSTFRQTSKLGIDFFREQNVPVLFQFSDHKGTSLAGGGKEKIVNENFWKNNEAGENGGSSITNSELRHINKILQNEQVDDKNSSQAGIYLASGGLQV